GGLVGVSAGRPPRPPAGLGEAGPFPVALSESLRAAPPWIFPDPFPTRRRIATQSRFAGKNLPAAGPILRDRRRRRVRRYIFRSGLASFLRLAETALIPRQLLLAVTNLIGSSVKLPARTS